ncbi:MAG: hypothetical protein OER95_05460 [Acidimicrobiia bacterium]|nr:hypothetical protein [Acidimicrobiia bacterium]
MTVVKPTGGRAQAGLTPEMAACVAELAQALEAIFTPLQQLGQALSACWIGTTIVDRQPFTTSEIAGLQPRVFELLDSEPAVDSAGYVLAENILADRARCLDWWHRSDDHHYQPLILELDLTSPDCYDYYTMDWFRAGVDEGRRFVSGPLIDLPCAAVYVFTFSQPVVVEGTFLGIAGADVALSRYEDHLVPPLLDLTEPAVVINDERRVIVSNDSRWTTGEKVRTFPVVGRDWQVVVPVAGDIGWHLAVAQTNHA